MKFQYPVDNPKIGFNFYSRYPFTWYFIRTGLAGKQHRGLDFLCKTGTPVKAPCRIQVTKVFSDALPGGKKNWHPDYGNAVYAYSLDDPTLELIFGHLYSIGYPAHLGKIWQKGEVFAWSGNTGKSTAPHLHFEIRRNGIKIDPSPLLV